MALKTTDFSSPFAQLYIALQGYIKANVPTIKHIALDIGQLDYYETRPAVSFPCLLIDFGDTHFNDEGQNVQWANITIKTRLGFAPFSRADSITPDVAVKEALQYFEIENQLYLALQGYTPTLKNDDNIDVEMCQPLSRINAAKEMRDDPFIVRVNMWSTAGEDDGAMVAENKVKATLQLE
jgi:hypothetical protein